MKIIQNKIIPFKGYVAITLYPFIFTRRELTSVELNHERIHARQQKELFIVFFYVIYLLEYLVLLIYIGNRKKAYSEISFEKEAYENQHDQDYLSRRVSYAWL